MVECTGNSDDYQGSVTRWVGEVKAGDELAAQRLWERYFDRLMRLCRKRLPDFARRVGDEEDIVLSAMDSFYRGAREGRFPQLADRDNLWRLLVVITARKAANYIRDQQRQKRGGGRLVGESALHEAVPESYGIEQVIGDEPSPHFAALFAEECQQRLQQLEDETLCEVAKMKLEGYSNLEVAKQLGSSLRTVERKLARIRGIWSEEEEST
jgi:DNA-directed RNA polymerase specialized sigma24 family protein